MNEKLISVIKSSLQSTTLRCSGALSKGIKCNESLRHALRMPAAEFSLSQQKSSPRKRIQQEESLQIEF